eukprot:TRINITY_DN5688_c0_g1_i1.p1 TRINITY_DN5688_c0_g1~~TRINITY_DN5688_c0_g1_i1.p1  ORF type:complete len:478 (+),score=59.10 TRINITY_DN5688_c0_g1_i1:119-1552(+)
MGQSVDVDRSRWIVLANFAFHSACNGFLWMDYSTIVATAEEALGVNEEYVNWLYSLSFMTACPSIFLVLLLVDRYDYWMTFAGTSCTILCAWLRWIAVWQESFEIAAASSAFLGLGVGIIFARLAELPAKWFGTDERNIATAIAVQSNFFGWAFGGVVVPCLVDTTASLGSFLLVQAGVVTVCLPAFFACHRVPGPSLYVDSPATTPTTAPPPSEPSSPAQEPKKAEASGLFSSIFGNFAFLNCCTRTPRTYQLLEPKPSSPKTAAAHAHLTLLDLKDSGKRAEMRSHCCNVPFLVQGLACALLQACGLSLPGLQEEVFAVQGYSPRQLMWMNFGWIMGGVVFGLVLGRVVPMEKPAATYRYILGLYWLAAIGLCALQIVYSQVQDLDADSRYLVSLLLVSLSGGCSLGYIGIALPAVCDKALPVSEAITGGLIELLGQVFGSALTMLSTGQEFKLFAAVALACALAMTLFAKEACA